MFVSVFPSFIEHSLNMCFVIKNTVFILLKQWFEIILAVSCHLIACSGEFNCNCEDPDWNPWQ